MTNRIPERTLEPAVGHEVHRHREFGPAMFVLPLDRRVSLNFSPQITGTLTVALTAGRIVH
jgi:hypothetical protein